MIAGRDNPLNVRRQAGPTEWLEGFESDGRKGDEDERLEIGVLVGVAVVVFVILAALAAGHRENIGLYRALRNAYDDLDERYRRLVIRAFELERLNDELEAVHSELVRKNRELAQSGALWARLAVTDTLTELANRRAFLDRLREEIARAQRYRYPFLLIMLDVDDFKPYNDAFLHTAGDQVLRGIATVMRETVREGDLVARYGGEEFAALLPQTDIASGRIVAERLRVAVERHPFAHRKVTLSIGVAEFDADGTESEPLIASADRAMYAAKLSGKNRVVFARDIAPKA